VTPERVLSEYNKYLIKKLLQSFMQALVADCFEIVTIPQNTKSFMLLKRADEFLILVISARGRESFA